MSITETTQSIFCNYCKRETTHVCKGQSHREYGEGEEWIGYKFLVCAGCGHGTLEKVYTGDWMEDSDGNQRYTFEYYPPRKYGCIEPKRFRSVPEKLATIYKEILNSINNDLMILGAIGIRILLEGICADKHIEGKNLEIKINNLSGILPKNIITNLHSMRFLGNEAAHELTEPSYAELAVAVEICEDLLNFIYELDYKASSLTEMRTRRKNQSYQLS